MFRFVILAVLIAFTEATKVSECESRLPLPNAVRIAGCDDPVCKFAKGSDVNVEIDFTMPSDATSLTGDILYIITGAKLYHPELPKNITNVCDNLKNNVRCPLKAHQSVTYLLLVKTKDLPAIRANVEVTLKNQNNDPLGCFAIEVSLIEPR